MRIAGSGRTKPPQARPQFLTVIAPQRLVGDLARQFVKPALEPGAPFGRIEGLGLGFARPQNIDERARRGKHFGNRPCPARAREIVGVLPVGQKGEAQAPARPDQRERGIDRPIGGLASGPVAIETEDRLFGHLPEEVALIGRQRRAERRHDMGETRRRHRDHIDIALDRDHRALVMRALARIVMVVEHRPLVEERGLGRVEIFGLRRVVQGAAAEGDDPAAAIGDREHHAVAETIIGDRDILAVHEEPRLDHRFERGALAGEMVAQGEFFGEPIAEPELALQRRGDAAIGEIATRLGALAALQGLPRRMARRARAHRATGALLARAFALAASATGRASPASAASRSTASGK